MKKRILIFILAVITSQLFAQQITLKNGDVMEIVNPVKRSKLSWDVKATIVSEAEYKIDGGSLFIKANSELTYDEKDLTISNCILEKKALLKSTEENIHSQKIQKFSSPVGQVFQTEFLPKMKQ